MAGEPEPRENKSGGGLLILLYLVAVGLLILAVIVLGIIRFVCIKRGNQKGALRAEEWLDTASYALFSLLMLPVIMFVVLIGAHILLVFGCLIIYGFLAYVPYKLFVYLPIYLFNRPLAYKFFLWEKKIYRGFLNIFKPINDKFERFFKNIDKRTLWGDMTQ